MIGQLRGILIEKTPPTLMLDVHGVGYCLQVPLNTFFSLPEIGQELILRTHFIVREDAQLLFGFVTIQECRLFQEIIKINGVGPKVALAILSGLTPEDFIDAVFSKETTRLSRLPGIGTKTAQRIIVEMQDRLPKMNQPYLKVKDPSQEAIEALIALGYKSIEATKAVSCVKNDYETCEQIIKEALQGLAKV